MNGIRKKITFGFVSLALLLFFAAVISMFELQRLSRNTRELLDAHSRYTRLSHEMLDAVQEQNAALLRTIIIDARRLDSAFLENRRRFDLALREATVTVRDRAELDSIYIASRIYGQVVNEYIGQSSPEKVDWFVNVYRTSYADLTRAVKNYMISSQYTLGAQAERLGDMAYRAITPSIITLGTAIILVLVFFFLIDLYYVRPTLQIDKSLKNYLNHKVPFSVRIEGRDEVFRLKESIETLIHLLKAKKPE